jgi:crotonobetainyl-CoA:carnitine CoA-transferase CaiB-like acyl-CoA transferase
MFGALGMLAALRTREVTGRGQDIQSGLFENCALLCAQHMQQFDVTGDIPPPMPDRTGGWAVYDIFDVADGEQLFLAVVSESQWRVFCREFGLDDLGTDPRLANNTLRAGARSWLIPRLRDLFRGFGKAELAAKFAENGLPFAPINRPDQLLDDPHLIESGGLVPMRTENGGTTRIPLLPLTFDGDHLGVRLGVPAVGEHGSAVLAEIGYSAEAQSRLVADGIVAFGQAEGAES